MQSSTNPASSPDVISDSSREIMDILQEECAEVIQAISKIRRFGLNNYKDNGLLTNREHLAEEIGQLFCMVKLLVRDNIVNIDEINAAQDEKTEKLKVWSNIANL
jgi:NTP pyrophosphatase (non-canonical NTP hydrolase)